MNPIHDTTIAAIGGVSYFFLHFFHCLNFEVWSIEFMVSFDPSIFGTLNHTYTICDGIRRSGTTHFKMQIKPRSKCQLMYTDNRNRLYYQVQF